MQHSIDKFSEACENFGHTISTNKNEVTRQPEPEKTYTEPNITVNEQRLNMVDKFTYNGCALSRNVVINDELNARLAKERAAFGSSYCSILLMFY